MNDSLKMPLISRTFAVSAITLAALIVLVAGLRADEEATKKVEKTSKLAADLIGTWKLVGALYVDEEEMKSRLKFFTGKHWNITHAHKDGKVLYHHGGTYTLNGDELSSTTEYANENTSNMIGRTNKFKINVDGDTYTQVGIGNSFHEIWKRAK